MDDSACASYDRKAVNSRVVVLERPAPLVRWCAAQDLRHAVVGGFLRRPGCIPLGEVQIEGEVRPSIAFDAPWGGVRACVHIVDGAVRIARRDQLGEDLDGDLLQAGPLLIADSQHALRDGEDREGFSAAARQFDSDITRGRFPRAAFGDRWRAAAGGRV